MSCFADCFRLRGLYSTYTLIWEPLLPRRSGNVYCLPGLSRELDLAEDAYCAAGNNELASGWRMSVGFNYITCCDVRVLVGKPA